MVEIADFDDFNDEREGRNEASTSGAEGEEQAPEDAGSTPPKKKRSGRAVVGGEETPEF
ncbi:MAG: hypothetical protein IJE97_03820 [Thermoguttaceae bacterium]|nr:hypothetical protein [Thermoguttaceae bacterium]MBQ7110998.1 hypothetical protein [Thermoguttaceae bacterium]